MNLEMANYKLSENGYVRIPSPSPHFLHSFLNKLGKIIQTTEISPRQNIRALVTSRRALGLHTDHHRANYIVWHCIKQSERGGESILADARSAYEAMGEEQRSIMANVLLREHCVFRNDMQEHPLVSFENGTPEFYYSFWMMQEGMTEVQIKSVNDFHKLVTSDIIEFKLNECDVLAVDNKRMLHGRHEIGDKQERLLRRYWIESNLKKGA